MKGYRMVLLVNAGLFFLTSVGALLMSDAIANEAKRCRSDASEKPQRCADLESVAAGTRRSSPGLFVVALVLLALGVFLGRSKPDPPREL